MGKALSVTFINKCHIRVHYIIFEMTGELYLFTKSADDPSWSLKRLRIEIHLVSKLESKLKEIIHNLQTIQTGV